MGIFGTVFRSSLLEANKFPDYVLRRAAKSILAARLSRIYGRTAEEQLDDLMLFAQSLKEMPIATDAEATSEEMYEMPPEFFKLLLGKNLKYSSLYFADKSYTIDQAEDAMLSLYCERAELKDGQSILDLGGGFGSLALFIAKKFPNTRVTSLSYSKMHKDFIDKECSYQGITNVKALNCDVSKFETEERFDRIFAIEILEHLKNYETLLKMVATLLKPDGNLFVEMFCNKISAYHFKDTDDEMVAWMAKYFFTGATMPAKNLLLYFQDDLSIQSHWLVNGSHLAKSCEVWVSRIDQNVNLIRPIFEKVYGQKNATRWIAYWRTFFIVSAEMFSVNKGQEWMVSHYLFKQSN